MADNPFWERNIRNTVLNTIVGTQQIKHMKRYAENIRHIEVNSKIRNKQQACVRKTVSGFVKQAELIKPIS